MTPESDTIPNLCQDCLREVLVQGWYDVDADELVCPCGGVLCPCSSCFATLTMLRAGERDPMKLGLLKVQFGFVWTPERGIVP